MRNRRRGNNFPSCRLIAYNCNSDSDTHTGTGQPAVMVNSNSVEKLTATNFFSGQDALMRVLAHCTIISCVRLMSTNKHIHAQSLDDNFFAVLCGRKVLILFNCLHCSFGVNCCDLRYSFSD